MGEDQVAHVELTREIARRFNGFYGVPREVFPEPQSLLTPAAKLPGTDGRKMSKSYGNTIMLTDPEPVVRQKLKTMVTDPARVRRSDPGNPDVCPVGDLHKIFSSKETMAKVNEGCRSAGIGCIECKGWAADALVQLLIPMQERRKKFEENPRLAWDILEAGHEAGTQGSGAKRWKMCVRPWGCRWSMRRRASKDRKWKSGLDGTQVTGLDIRWQK